MDSLSDEVSLVIYSYLQVKDLLVMRKVSVRHARLTMDKEMWKSTRIIKMNLFRDERYFTGKGRSETLLANMQDTSGDDLAWLVCRVHEVSWPSYNSSPIWLWDEAWQAIIREAGEGTSQLKELGIKTHPAGLDNPFLARALTKIATVKLARHLHDLVDAPTTQAQSTALFSSIFQAILTEEELDLENLTIEFYNLGNVDGGLLAGALTRMKTISLWHTCLLYTSPSPRDS